MDLNKQDDIKVEQSDIEMIETDNLIVETKDETQVTSQELTGKLK